MQLARSSIVHRSILTALRMRDAKLLHVRPYFWETRTTHPRITGAQVLDIKSGNLRSRIKHHHSKHATLFPSIWDKILPLVNVVKPHA